MGDIIDFLGEVEEGWWRGKLAGKVGVFPSNFVVQFNSTSPVLANRRSATGTNVSRIRNSLSSSREDLVSTVSEKDAPSLPPKPGKNDDIPNAKTRTDLPNSVATVRELCKVLFPYEASNEDELDLKEGDVISILSKELPDKGWWRGELKGKIGVFPDNFVQILSPEGMSLSVSISFEHEFILINSKHVFQELHRKTTQTHCNGQTVHHPQRNS